MFCFKKPIHRKTPTEANKLLSYQSIRIPWVKYQYKGVSYFSSGKNASVLFPRPSHTSRRKRLISHDSDLYTNKYFQKVLFIYEWVPKLSGHELLIIIITRHVIVQSNQTISLPFHTLCMQLFVEILSKNAPFARQIWLIGTIVQHAIGSKQSRGNRDATRVEKWMCSPNDSS